MLALFPQCQSVFTMLGGLSDHPSLSNLDTCGHYHTRSLALLLMMPLSRVHRAPTLGCGT